MLRDFQRIESLDYLEQRWKYLKNKTKNNLWLELARYLWELNPVYYPNY